MLPQREGGGRNCSLTRCLNTLVRSFGPSLTRLDFSHHGRSALRRVGLDCEAPTRPTGFSAIETPSLGTIISSRICIIPHHAAAGQDKHTRRRPSRNHHLLAAISLLYDFLSILTTGRSSCGRSAWRCIVCADLCFSSEGTRRALQ